MRWEITADELSHTEKLDCCIDCWFYMRHYEMCGLDKERSPFKIACDKFVKSNPIIEKIKRK